MEPLEHEGEPVGESGAQESEGDLWRVVFKDLHLADCLTLQGMPVPQASVEFRAHWLAEPSVLAPPHAAELQPFTSPRKLVLTRRDQGRGGGWVAGCSEPL